MEAKEVFDRFPDTFSDRAVGQCKVWVEHRIDKEISEHKREELGGGLDVVGTSDAARLENLREEDMAALHTLVPYGARKVGKSVHFSHHDAMQREKLRRTEHVQYLAPELGQHPAGSFS
jgi:hypothetical protein